MSKNDMVMVPRELTPEMRKAYEEHSLAPIGPISKTGYSAMLDAAPAAHYHADPVALPARIDPPKNGESHQLLPRYLVWNACLDEIAKLGPLYSRPVQGEPVAWRGINELGEVVTEWIDGAPPESMVDLCGNPASFAKIEQAYTNVDPGEVDRHIERRMEMAGEKTELYRKVERLRAEISEQTQIIEALCEGTDGSTSALLTIGRLQTQLAERDALMRSLDDAWNSHDGRAWFGKLMQKVESLIASAEPSAPKCGNCGSGTGQACNDKGCGYLESGNGEPSAPVEIDERADVQQLTEALRTCEKWFAKHSPTAPLIGGFGDAEHPMLTFIRAALEQSHDHS